MHLIEAYIEQVRKAPYGEDQEDMINFFASNEIDILPPFVVKDKEMIDCVDTYYLNLENDKTKPKGSDIAKCLATRIKLNVQDKVDIFECSKCHLQCLTSFNEGKLRVRSNR